MAESQKGGSSTADPKEKNSLLADMDFGKDFFSSWKSVTVSEDDAMDFDFGSVAKGKKKAFNFDKLDVDFSLDGDLDKISSFKVDMSDLDISSPPKKAGTKERSKEDSGNGNLQRKQDRFSFPFDFNELDNFGFEPSLKKDGSDNSSKDRHGEKASNRRECQGSITEQSDGKASDGVNPDLSASGAVAASKVKTTVDDYGKIDSTDHSHPLNTRIDEIDPSKLPNNQKLVEVREAVTFPKMKSDTSTQEMAQDNIPRETASPKPYTRENATNLCIKSISEDQTTQVTYSELQAEVSSRATEDALGEQNGNSESIAAMEPKTFLLGNSEQTVASSCGDEDGRNSCSGDDTVSIKNGSEPAPGDADSADTSSTNTSRKSLSVIEASRGHQNGSPEVQLSSPNSGISELVKVKEKETGVIRSKFFKRSDDRESQLHDRRSSQTAIPHFPGKVISFKLQTDERRDGSESEDGPSRNKLHIISSSHSIEVTKGESGKPVSAKTFRGLKDIGESLKTDGLHGNKLMSSSRLNDQDIAKGESVRGLENNTKNLVTLSAAFKSFNPVEQKPKSITQIQATSKTVLSTLSLNNALNASNEGNKASKIKANRSLPDLSDLKISRTVAAYHSPSNSTVQKQTTVARTSRHNQELEGSIPSRISPTINTEKHSQSSPSLKRKSYEASNADMLNIKPLKRFSQSPSESRNVKELSGIVNQEDRNNVDIEKSHHSDCFQTSPLHITPLLSLKDLKMSLVIQNDDNVEKAEAYTKDLEDMCNMLKKKHEEAKELLVRAIVSNNNLLMLNHPIYEEKFHKVQKFAAQLMSKEIHA